MSTTVTISPTSEGNGVANVAAAGVAALGAALAAVLTDDAECQRMLAQVREEQRAARLASANLRTPDLARLAQSAREANFTVRAGRDWLRIDVPGQAPVWVAKRETGLALAGGREALQRVLVANTVSRLSQPLAARGFTVGQAPARRGRNDVELIAKAADNREIRVSVAASGDATVDPLNYHGTECDPLVKDLAAAVDGTITSYCRKPEYFGGGTVRIAPKQRV